LAKIWTKVKCHVFYGPRCKITTLYHACTGKCLHQFCLDVFRFSRYEHLLVTRKLRQIHLCDRQTDRQIDRQTDMDGRPVMWPCMRRHMITATSKPDDSVPDCWISYNLSSEESRQRHANRPDLHISNSQHQHIENLSLILVITRSAQINVYCIGAHQLCNKYSRWKLISAKLLSVHLTTEG